MRSLGILLTVLVLACDASPTDPDGSVRELRIAFGNSTQVNSELRVSFAQLIEDSRCPASVVCAWQGNGAIRLEITSGRGVESVTLNTAGGTSFPREASAGGYTFALVELEPQRETTDSIPVQRYHATIRVTPAQ